jgi:hypothetical protein
MRFWIWSSEQVTIYLWAMNVCVCVCVCVYIYIFHVIVCTSVCKSTIKLLCGDHQE